MISLKDAAEYYEVHGLYVVPNDFDATNIEYCSVFSSQNISIYDWEHTKSIKCILSQKNARAIVLHRFKEESEEYNHNILKKVLDKLGLKRYPWIIRTPDKIIILVQSGDKLRQGNIYTRAISLYLTGYVYLPFEDSSNQFYFNGIPTIGPEYISIARLLRCYNEIAEEMSWADYFSHVWSFRDFVNQNGELSEIRTLDRNADGKTFKLCVFEKDTGQTFASLYSSIGDMGYEDIIETADNLKVGRLLDSKRYTIFEDWKGWKRVDIEKNLDINKPVPVPTSDDPLEDYLNYCELHGFLHDNLDTPEDIEEMNRISDELAREQDIKDEARRKNEIEKDNEKRSNENLFDFSGDDSSLNPVFW